MLGFSYGFRLMVIVQLRFWFRDRAKFWLSGSFRVRVSTGLEFYYI